MTVTDLITDLKKVLDEHGDVEVFVSADAERSTAYTYEDYEVVHHDGNPEEDAYGVILWSSFRLV